jgi:hypothetical protein
MTLWICRWPNGDRTIVLGASKEDAIRILDEIGDASAEMLERVPADTRKPTYEDRRTGRRFAITPEPVWVCDGCTYEAANFKGRYIDERTSLGRQ